MVCHFHRILKASLPLDSGVNIGVEEKKSNVNTLFEQTL